VKPTCVVYGCVKPSRCRGWCSAHYERWRRHGSPNIVLARAAPPRPPRTQRAACQVSDCGARPLSRNLCSKHYQRLRKYGDPTASVRRSASVCNVDDCEMSVHGRGMCRNHWATWRKHGDPCWTRPVLDSCRVAGCARRPRSRTAGICDMHYYRIRRNGTLKSKIPALDLPVSATCDHCGKPNDPNHTVARRYCSKRCDARARRGVSVHPGVCVTCTVRLPYGSRSDRQYCDLCYLDRIRADQRDRQHRRRVVVAGLDGGMYERIDSREIYERDRWRCGLCGKKVNRRLRYPHHLSASLDHIVPIADGGRHVRANVQLAHWICNSRKQHRGGGEQLALIG